MFQTIIKVFLTFVTLAWTEHRERSFRYEIISHEDRGHEIFVLSRLRDSGKTFIAPVISLYNRHQLRILWKSKVLWYLPKNISQGLLFWSMRMVVKQNYTGIRVC